MVRQGGDEFPVLAPETDVAAAARLVGRIGAALGGVDAGGKAISASVGWALHPDDAEEGRALMEIADARRRAVKRARQASASFRMRLSA